LAGKISQIEEAAMLQISIFGKEGVLQVHEATMRILAETGIVLTHPRAREILGGHGATINQDRVLLPRELVEKCLAQIPPTVKLQGRDPEKAIEFHKDAWYAHNVGGVPNAFEPQDNSRRPATCADVAKSTRLLDALPNVASITPLYTPQDVPGEAMTLWMAYETLANTTKPFRAPGVQTGREVEALAEIFAVACPEGTATVGISPISPLTFPDEIVEAILATVSQGWVLGPLPCPILGATAPMSIAGGLAQQNAEVLASVVLAQLVQPGTAVIYKGRLSVMDPRTGLSVWGNPEIGMISAATVEIGQFYGMPVDVYGLCTNSHTIDAQSGHERALNALLPILAGADEISGIGEMDGGVNASLAQIVIDDEILSSLQRIRRSIKVDSDSLAVDEIAAVMDGPQNFLAEEHTVRFLRSGEVLRPQLALRNTWSQWEAADQKNLLERAQHKVTDLLDKHEVPPLSEKRIAALQEVIRAF
jgi:trimethylamine--corrinoid protein Co-methyltransferase